MAERAARAAPDGARCRPVLSSRRPHPLLTDTSVAEVLEHALGIERGRWTQADQNRVVRCLVSMGFKRRKVRRNGGREWRYLRDPDTRGACGPSGPTLPGSKKPRISVPGPSGPTRFLPFSWGPENALYTCTVSNVNRTSTEEIGNQWPQWDQWDHPSEISDLAGDPSGTASGTSGAEWDHARQPEEDPMHAPTAADHRRADERLEAAVRTAISSMNRDRSAGAADRLEAARDAFARAWGRRQGLAMAKPGSPWWRLLEPRARDRCPERLPGDDHVSLWLRDRKPEVYVAQPYGLSSCVLREMVGAAERYGLEFTISTWPAWWNPGAVLFVEWRRAERP